MDSDDDDFALDDFDFSTISESELQAIEKQVYARVAKAAENQPLVSPTPPSFASGPTDLWRGRRTLPVGSTAYIPDEAVRRERERLEHVAIKLERDDGRGNDDEQEPASLASLCGSAADAANGGAEDIFNMSGSQRSVYEDALVEQVSFSVPPVGTPSHYQLELLRADESLASTSSESTSFLSTAESIADGAAPKLEEQSDHLMDFNSEVDPEEDQDRGNKSKRRKNISLFKRFRKRGFFSVTDLVSPGWCEVQYDYRLRSMPYLPVADRPAQITTSSGALITLNKTLATTHEKIMKKGEVVHKALEMEIHPVEIKVTTTTREDVWGLRFLNMLGSLEALMKVGKCREMPVVGFVRGYMVVGVIDEIERKPVISLRAKSGTGKTPLGDSTNLPTATEGALLPKRTPSKRLSSRPSPPTPPRSQPKSQQQPLTKFFTSTPLLTTGRIARNEAFARKRTHSLYVSDSKTRAGGTMPREENSRGGKMQLMLYKELLDGMVLEGLRGVENGRAADVTVQEQGTRCEPQGVPQVNFGVSDPATSSLEQVGPATSPVDRFTWPLLWTHLDLDPSQPFSETFLSESRSVIEGNGLSDNTGCATCLADMAACWTEYVSKLGVGLLDPSMGEEEGENKRVGRGEMLLELVYRRVESSGSEEKKKQRRRKQEKGSAASVSALDEAIRASLSSEPLPAEQEEDRLLQLALAESLKEVDTQIPTLDPGILEQVKEVEKPSSSLEPDPSCDVDHATDVAEMEPLQAALFPPDLAPAAETPLPPGDRMDIEAEPEALKMAQSTPDQGSVECMPSANLIKPSLSSDALSQAPQGISQGKRGHVQDSNIIGSIRFTHSRPALSSHLSTTLDFWLGRREPIGVQVEDVARCGWCEFEEGCEWRSKKADEAAERGRKIREQRERGLSTQV